MAQLYYLCLFAKLSILVNLGICAFKGTVSIISSKPSTQRLQCLIYNGTLETYLNLIISLLFLIMKNCASQQMKMENYKQKHGYLISSWLDAVFMPYRSESLNCGFTHTRKLFYDLFCFSWYFLFPVWSLQGPISTCQNLQGEKNLPV